MPTPIKRRCYVEILEDGKAKFTNSYNTREIEFKDKNKRYFVDLVALRIQTKEQERQGLYAIVQWRGVKNNFVVSVWNGQEKDLVVGSLGEVGIGNGLPLSNNFECVLFVRMNEVNGYANHTLI